MLAGRQSTYFVQLFCRIHKLERQDPDNIAHEGLYEGGTCHCKLRSKLEDKRMPIYNEMLLEL